MDDDDIAMIVLQRIGLDSLQTLGRIAQVDRRLCALSCHNIVWRAMCIQRWSAFPQAEVWLREASEMEKNANSASAVWKAAFKQRLRKLISNWPVFYMIGSYAIGRPVGLHFFEERYKALIAEAMAADQRFVFASSPPREGDTALLCECHQVRCYTDGRIYLIALPVATVYISRTWTTGVALHHFTFDPPLHWARAEILPPLTKQVGANELRQVGDVRSQLTAVNPSMLLGADPEFGDTGLQTNGADLDGDVELFTEDDR